MPSQKTDPDYQLHPDGRFAVRGYQDKKPFSNFLPGIAGLDGTPMWVFYVNRGQGVVSFGTRDKDRAILEFFPANKAYQMAGSVGFRTFVKYRAAKSTRGEFSFYEPFRRVAAPTAPGVEETMEVGSHEFSIVEKNPSVGLETRATYFTVPGEPLAALAREVVLTNTGRAAIEVELLDGLPGVNPFGMNEFFMKQMSRTIEAWMIVENLAKKAPFFRLKVDATDRPEVVAVRQGNFYFACPEKRGRAELLEPVVDPAKVFGPRLDFSDPQAFRAASPFKHSISGQIRENKTPSAFAFSSFKLAPGQAKKIRSFCGQADSLEILNCYASRASRDGYFDAKRLENRKHVESIKAAAFTVSASPVYDLYAGQTYLDNALRGGKPVCLAGGREPFIFYVYSRKHGDLERDYNRFLVEPSYFAQGDGNYRDVNQNRRSDVWFEPRVRDANIRTFLNLVQLDGFNPLIIKGTEFHWKRSSESARVLRSFFGAKDSKWVAELLSRPFKIGGLCRRLEERTGITQARFRKFLEALWPHLKPEEKAEHGEGFWTDHWTYNLDLVENYLAIYPEELGALFFEKRDYTFFDNDHWVRPRDEKIRLEKGELVRQYQAVGVDKQKSRLIAHRAVLANAVRTRHGRGEVYRTTLFVKLLTLAANKLASLDAEGAGVQMEADKPSWYDALNGLPGLLGSSMPETFELKRLLMFLIQVIEDSGIDPAQEIPMPVESADFVAKLAQLLEKHFKDKSAGKNFAFWDASGTLKERFRAETRWGVSGREHRMKIAALKSFLEHAREKVEIGIEKAFDPKTGLFPTYFENEVVSFRKLPSRSADTVHVRPTRFRSKPLPFFLEGPVHALKVEKDPSRRKSLWKAVRRSSLYDAKLGMYKVNAPLDGAPLEVGRARVFTPGWLENESVWLHMEYKWLLETLKAGLHDEFFEDFRKAFVPFQPPARYGRSPIENSSFIVSSAFPDPSLHGTGFVARLSGSTAEFLSMWLLMNAGRRPFVLGPDRKVSLRFEPHLPAFLFTKEETVRSFWDADGEETKIKIPKDAFAFLFLGKTLVVYHNPKQLDTFGKMRVAVKKISLRDARGNVTEFKGDTVPSPWSLRVRDAVVPRIDVELG